MEKTCSKCGVVFGCQNEMPGCWCEEVKLSPETLENLKEGYENCLCPACLKGFEEKGDEEVSQPGKVGGRSG
jgi:hypothetical protein